LASEPAAEHRCLVLGGGIEQVDDPATVGTEEDLLI
jgi:hypothetical protein